MFQHHRRKRFWFVIWVEKIGFPPRRKVHVSAPIPKAKDATIESARLTAEGRPDVQILNP